MSIDKKKQECVNAFMELMNVDNRTTQTVHTLGSRLCDPKKIVKLFGLDQNIEKFRLRYENNNGLTFGTLTHLAYRDICSSFQYKFMINMMKKFLMYCDKDFLFVFEFHGDMENLHTHFISDKLNLKELAYIRKLWRKEFANKARGLHFRDVRGKFDNTKSYLMKYQKGIIDCGYYPYTNIG